MTFFSANVGYVLLVSKRHTWNITLQRTLGNACFARCSENETKNSSTGGDGMGGRREGSLARSTATAASAADATGKERGLARVSRLGFGGREAARRRRRRCYSKGISPSFLPSFENDLDDDTRELFAVRTELGVEK